MLDAKGNALTFTEWESCLRLLQKMVIVCISNASNFKPARSQCTSLAEIDVSEM